MGRYVKGAEHRWRDTPPPYLKAQTVLWQPNCSTIGLRDYKPIHRDIVHPSWGDLDARERNLHATKLKKAFAATRTKTDPRHIMGPSGFRPPPAARHSVFDRLSAAQ